MNNALDPGNKGRHDRPAPADPHRSPEASAPEMASARRAKRLLYWVILGLIALNVGILLSLIRR